MKEPGKSIPHPFRKLVEEAEGITNKVRSCERSDATI